MEEFEGFLDKSFMEYNDDYCPPSPQSHIDFDEVIIRKRKTKKRKTLPKYVVYKDLTERDEVKLTPRQLLMIMKKKGIITEGIMELDKETKEICSVGIPKKKRLNTTPKKVTDKEHTINRHSTGEEETTSCSNREETTTSREDSCREESILVSAKQENTSDKENTSREDSNTKKEEILVISSKEETAANLKHKETSKHKEATVSTSSNKKETSNHKETTTNLKQKDTPVISSKKEATISTSTNKKEDAVKTSLNIHACPLDYSSVPPENTAEYYDRQNVFLGHATKLDENIIHPQDAYDRVSSSQTKNIPAVEILEAQKSTESITALGIGALLAKVQKEISLHTCPVRTLLISVEKRLSAVVSSPREHIHMRSPEALQRASQSYENITQSRTKCCVH
ncbi:uncharacterized protein NESG_02072 [Nematocida ausubeli]|uniref:Uncharacterized protein n=1 Tax=Nematocida ausubeli (strain ATCC PRA-371 / ERTm2) TaxID=1913371 RepID=A0A086IZI3_NEMA1|nr:uncharacterized protein NESG_02072 [Nematocida ausubeli]KFG25301.1 hypothetical protein NESG_02072 [Nematocida ausubeli]